MQELLTVLQCTESHGSNKIKIMTSGTKCCSVVSVKVHFEISGMLYSK